MVKRDQSNVGLGKPSEQQKNSFLKTSNVPTFFSNLQYSFLSMFNLCAQIETETIKCEPIEKL